MVHRLCLVLTLLCSVTAALAETFPTTIPPRSKDTSGSYKLRWLSGSSLTADRDFTLVTGDAARTLTLSANVSLNQSLLTTSTPTFAGPETLTASNGVGWLILKPSDYGTSYTDGTVGYYQLGTNEGSQSAAAGTWAGALDRVFFEGYNLDPNGQGATVLDTNDDGFCVHRLERNWIWQGDETLGSGTFTPSLATNAGNTEITAAAGNLTTIAVGDYVKFNTSGNKYKITIKNSTTKVTVAGTAAASEPGTCSLLTRTMEFHWGPVWKDGTAMTRMMGVIVNKGSKYCRLDYQADAFNWFDNTGTQIFAIKKGANEGLLWDQNATYLKMSKAASTRTNIIGITSSDVIEIGETGSALAVSMYGSLTLPAGSLTLTSGSETITSGNLTISAGTLSQTISGTSNSSMSQTYTGSSTGVSASRGLLLTSVDSGTSSSSRNEVGIDLSATVSGNSGALATTSTKLSGVKVTYGKTAASTISAGTHYYAGVDVRPVTNAGTNTGGSVAQVDYYSLGPTAYSGTTSSVLSAAFGGDELLASGKKLILEGAVGTPATSSTTPTLPTVGDSYLTLNTTGGTGSTNAIELYVDGTKQSFWDSAGLNVASDVIVTTAGKGLKVKEGSNARMGTSTLSAGSVVVSNTSVTANTRIFLTVQSLGTVAAPKAVAVTARSANTSFTITSADATDTSVVAWMLVEPSP